MAKFELTMVVSYCRDWTPDDAFREIVQNLLDGNDRGYKMEIGHVTIQGQAFTYFRNHGYVADKSIWLLGKTDKDGDTSQRGRHGDGLKSGSAVLVRNGIPMFIMNGSEKWTPEIGYSDTFHEDVLTITTRAGSSRYEPFTVYVAMTEDQWNAMKSKFLPFCNIAEDQIKKTYAGTLILDPAYAGQIFVKGIFVQRMPDFEHGYDLDIDLDRDRNIVSKYNVTSCAARILRDVMQREIGTVESVYALLDNNKPDAEDVAYWIDDSQAQAMVEIFKGKHGDKAIPVQSAAEATRVEHYGMTGVVVPDGLRSTLVKVMGSTDQTIAKAMDSCGEYVQDATLDTGERTAYRTAINLALLSGIIQNEDQIRIFSWRTPDAPRGTYNHGTGEIRINRSILSETPGTTVTLLHEIAHDAGRDGTLDHRAREEKLIAKVIGTLLDLVPDKAWLAE